MSLLSEEYLKKMSSSIITPYEAKVLRLYRTMSVKKMATELGTTQNAIYGVFRTVRDRRVHFQRGVNFWNSVCRDKRYNMVLTPRPQLQEEEEP